MQSVCEAGLGPLRAVPREAFKPPTVAGPLKSIRARHATPGPSHRGHARENALRGKAQVYYVYVKEVIYSLVKIYLFPPAVSFSKRLAVLNA